LSRVGGLVALLLMFRMAPHVLVAAKRFDGGDDDVDALQTFMLRPAVLIVAVGDAERRRLITVRDCGVVAEAEAVAKADTKGLKMQTVVAA